MQKSQFWTAIVKGLPMAFASFSAGTRLDLVGWITIERRRQP